MGPLDSGLQGLGGRCCGFAGGVAPCVLCMAALHQLASGTTSQLSFPEAFTTCTCRACRSGLHGTLA